MKYAKLDDDTLMAYVDGLLDEEQRDLVEHALETDPGVCERVAVMADARKQEKQQMKSPLGQNELQARVRAFASQPNTGRRKKKPQGSPLLRVAAVAAAIAIIAIWAITTGGFTPN